VAYFLGHPVYIIYGTHGGEKMKKQKDKRTKARSYPYYFLKLSY